MGYIGVSLRCNGTCHKIPSIVWQFCLSGFELIGVCGPKGYGFSAIVSQLYFFPGVEVLHVGYIYIGMCSPKGYGFSAVFGHK